MSRRAIRDDLLAMTDEMQLHRRLAGTTRHRESHILVRRKRDDKTHRRASLRSLQRDDQAMTALLNRVVGDAGEGAEVDLLGLNRLERVGMRSPGHGRGSNNGKQDRTNRHQKNPISDKVQKL